MQKPLPRYPTPVDAILAASRALVGVAATSLTVLGDDVTLQQWRALVLVADGRVSGPGDLAVALGVHPSNATRVVDRMVSKDLLVRTEARSDRRNVSLSIGATGRTALQAVTARRQAAIEKIIQQMPTQRATDVAVVLGELAAAAGEAADEAWRLGWGNVTREPAADDPAACTEPTHSPGGS